jgi:cyanophycinase-like exopeptidase
MAGGNESISGAGTDRVVHLALRRTGIARPRVAYVGAASGDNPAVRRRHIARLRKAGAGPVLPMPLCGKRGSASRAAAALGSADVVFFCGGDVEAGMRTLEARGMVSLLRTAHRSGVPFIGISAGSIMLCRSWIRWADPGDEASAELFPCLGLCRIICDTHGEGDGWGELESVLHRRPIGSTGYGIVSGSALVVEPDGSVSPFGGEVHVLKRRTTGIARVRSLRPGPRAVNGV